MVSSTPLAARSTGSASTFSSRCAASAARASPRQPEAMPATGDSALIASRLTAIRPPTVISCWVTATAPAVTTSTENTVSSTVLLSRAVSSSPFLRKLSASQLR
ncbi:hypothetical protein FQZ97_1072880 [compost metagenome]